MVTRRAKKRATPLEAPRALHYKVVELPNVDEGALERTLNEWSALGWRFDGVQFAMRESSKRPSMAFVIFTREGPPLEPVAIVTHLEAHRDPAEAEAHLRRLAQSGEEDAMQSAWERLHELAGEDES